MRICGVIAEYNPFHNGHKYLLDEIKKQGFDAIVAVMSGNYVQRGEASVVKKSVRAKSALLNGVDLVIELPIPFVLSSAQRFAFGAVSILDSLGIVESICFGSECGNIEHIKKVAETNFDGKLNDYLTDGKTYASALQSYFEDEFGKEYSEILSSPNNVLGIEYIKALRKLNSKITPLTVKRIGTGHSQLKAENGFCSAKYIRDNIDNPKVFDNMPSSSSLLFKQSVSKSEAPVRLENNEAVILSSLRMKNEEYFASLPDLSEGIENRLYSAVRNACSLEELYSLIKTKRYTMARVKRLVLNAFLGVTNDYSGFSPTYIRVLGFNETGREIIKNAKLFSSKPIYSLYSDFSNADDISKKLYSLECSSTDLYNCFTPEIMPCGAEQRENIVIIK